MKTECLDYHLPQDLIAQQPSPERQKSRLLQVSRGTGAIAHHAFDNLPHLLRPGDLLVLNDTRVMPARIDLQRQTGGEIEGLFLQDVGGGRWRVMLRGRGRIKVGEVLNFRRRPEQGLKLISNDGEGIWTVNCEPHLDEALPLLREIGRMPLPPYIRRSADDSDDTCQTDNRRYQTTFARNDGAVAAPTAGLHFTPQILDALRRNDVEHCFITLHVGIGTFRPVTAERLQDHKMHSEYYRLQTDAAATIGQALNQGRRIVAVGTTCVRVLETLAARGENWRQATEGWTDIFIYPPYNFRAVGAMITNFHLPRSTLLALVAAFAGRELIMRAYREAIAQQYRFYSYGDACLIE